MEADADLGIGGSPAPGDPGPGDSLDHGASGPQDSPTPGDSGPGSIVAPGPGGRRTPGDPGPLLTATGEPRPAVPGSPSSAPSPAQSPAPGSQRLLFVDDLVSGTYKGALRHGIVGLIHGEVSSGESSDTDEEGTGRERPLKKGYVRVQWYPEGGKQDVKEIK
eukprot:g43180.t1